MYLNGKMEINDLTNLVIEKCIAIHTKFGPGCFERVYEELLCYELQLAGVRVERQVLLPITHGELYIPNAYKIDILVDRRLVVELKSIYPLPSVYYKQIRTQLSLINLKHGLLINFKEELMKNGIHRVFNNFGNENLDSPPT